MENINNTKHSSSYLPIRILKALAFVFLGFIAGLFLAGAGLFSPFSSGEPAMQKECTIIQECDAVSKESVQKEVSEKEVQDALDLAHQQLAEGGLIKPDNEAVNYLRANVKSISGQNIIVEFKASDLDIFKAGMATKIVIVSSDDTIKQHIPKPDEQFKQEYAEFEKAYKIIEARLEADPDIDVEKPEEPLAYTIKYLKVSDLNEGDELEIFTDVDIRMNDSFEAGSIELLENEVILDEEEKEEAVFPDGNFTDPSPI